ncbi:MAG: twin-arginine translocase subunit TatC [Actinobacteria bacterium]|nr:MAG: twin-arginine translocase subunit TatC [Actinomycetota bacterium]
MRGFPRRLRHGEEATLVEHLGELRTRLIVALGAIAAAFIVTYVFHGHLLHWLNRPLPPHLRKPVTFSPIEPFTTSIWVSLWAAFLLALPIVFWQLWAFLAPAVEEHRQRSMAMLVGFATLLGLGGVAFGYYVILPPAIHFLTNYDSAHYDILIRARDYYRFVSFVLLGVALAFEVPVFVLALVRLRILTAKQLRRTWRMGIFVMTVIGVLLPGVDPVSTILSVIPLVGLYLLSIALAAFFEPRWRSEPSTATVAE